MRKRIAFALGFLALATGSAGGHRTGALPQLIGFDTYIEPVGDFEATRLVRLDLKTFRRLPERGLKLGDAVSSDVLGPDGRTLAVGGINYGEVILVDLGHLTRTTRIQ